jgi:hypothetical protein
MAFPCPAVPAVAAGDMAFTADPVTRMVALHLVAHVLDDAVVLVAHHHGHRNGFLSPRVPVVDVDIGPADGALVDPDEHIVRPHLRHGDVSQPDALVTPGLEQGFHGCLQAFISPLRGMGDLAEGKGFDDL